MDARGGQRIGRVVLGLQALVRARELVEQLQDERDTQADRHDRVPDDRAREDQREERRDLPVVAGGALLGASAGFS